MEEGAEMAEARNSDHAVPDFCLTGVSGRGEVAEETVSIA